MMRIIIKGKSAVKLPELLECVFERLKESRRESESESEESSR